jgi:hypothetical protein
MVFRLMNAKRGFNFQQGKGKGKQSYTPDGLYVEYTPLWATWEASTSTCRECPQE